MSKNFDLNKLNSIFIKMEILTDVWIIKTAQKIDDIFKTKYLNQFCFINCLINYLDIEKISKHDDTIPQSATSKM